MSDDNGWSGLDQIGNSASGLASSILDGAGSLIAGAVNKKVNQPDTTPVAPQTKAPAPDPNAWQKYLAYGVGALVLVVVLVKVLKS